MDTELGLDHLELGSNTYYLTYTYLISRKKYRLHYIWMFSKERRLVIFKIQIQFISFQKFNCFSEIVYIMIRETEPQVFGGFETFFSLF